MGTSLGLTGGLGYFDLASVMTLLPVVIVGLDVVWPQVPLAKSSFGLGLGIGPVLSRLVGPEPLSPVVVVEAEDVAIRASEAPHHR